MWIRNKRETWSHTKEKADFTMSLRDILKVLFTRFLFEHHLDSKICPSTWMEDSNKQTSSAFWRYLAEAFSPCASTFHHHSDCFLSYNTMHTGILHWNISYICHVQIVDPFNKICIITITNFTNNKSKFIIVRKSCFLLMLDWDGKNHVHPLYNVYIQSDEKIQT